MAQYIMEEMPDIHKTGNHEFSEGDMEDTTSTEPVAVKSGSGEGERKTEVHVNVSLNPTFRIDGNGGNESDIIRVVRTHMRELADEIGGELAERLEMVFSNMPVKEA